MEGIPGLAFDNDHRRDILTEQQPSIHTSEGKNGCFKTQNPTFDVIYLDN